MPGTRKGAKKAAITNKGKYGSDFYARIGQKGGRVKVPKGFAKNRELASRVGVIGGRKGRRGLAKK